MKEQSIAQKIKNYIILTLKEQDQHLRSQLGMEKDDYIGYINPKVGVIIGQNLVKGFLISKGYADNWEYQRETNSYVKKGSQIYIPISNEIPYSNELISLLRQLFCGLHNYITLP